MLILSLPGARGSIRRSDKEQRDTGWAVAACRTVAGWIARPEWAWQEFVA